MKGLKSSRLLEEASSRSKRISESGYMPDYMCLDQKNAVTESFQGRFGSQAGPPGLMAKRSKQIECMTTQSYVLQSHSRHG